MPDLTGPRLRSRAGLGVLVLLLGLAAAQPAAAGQSFRLGGVFTGGSGRLSSDSFGLTACIDWGIAGAATSASHSLVAGCGAVTGFVPGAGYFTVAPCRLLDTRILGGPLASGVVHDFVFTGVCGIPATARALAVVVTVVSPSGDGGLEVIAGGTPPAQLEMVRFRAGQTRAGNGIVLLGPDGSVDLVPTVAGGGAVHVVVDVSGYLE